MRQREPHSLQKCNGCIFALTCNPAQRVELFPMEGSLRERKKQRTREQIVDAAFALFLDRGFHATTVADIAAAADIAPRTFFAYFPSKEAVVFHDFDTILASTRAALEGRPEGESTIDALRRWIIGNLSDDHHDRREEILRNKLREEDPGLAAYEQHLRSGFVDLLAEGVARDLGVAPDSLQPKLVAASVMAALTTIDKEGVSKPEATKLFDEALLFLRGGVAALQAGR